MNQTEKINEYKSQRYYDMVQMQLFQWLRYWVDANPETIEHDDPEIKNKLIDDTKKVMEQIISNSDRVVRRVMVLGINHSRINEIAALTEADLKVIIDSVMGTNLAYVIGDGNIY